MPSFTGSSIVNKPAYLMRNEKFHKDVHNEYVPTVDETVKMIDMWLSFKNSQLCSNANEKTIQEVLEERQRQNIDTNLLDDLMLATEVKTIQRNGIRFLGCDYFDEKLYGVKSKVLIKYSMFDLRSIKVFTIKGEFLCNAERVTETHPMAKILGTVEDLEDFKQKIEKQKALKHRTLNSVKKYLPVDDVKFLEMQIHSEVEVLLGAEAKLPPLKEERKINGKPIFKNNLEKYEWFVKNEPQSKWLQEFKQSREYELYYE